eukprot:s2089_g1.t1
MQAAPWETESSARLPVVKRNASPHLKWAKKVHTQQKAWLLNHRSRKGVIGVIALCFDQNFTGAPCPHQQRLQRLFCSMDIQGSLQLCRFREVPVGVPVRVPVRVPGGSGLVQEGSGLGSSVACMGRFRLQGGCSVPWTFRGVCNFAGLRRFREHPVMVPVRVLGWFREILV